MRTIVIAVAFFALAPVALGGSVPAGGACPNGTSDCESGLVCSAAKKCEHVATTPAVGTTLINPLKSGTSLESFLNDILEFVIRIGTIAVILMIVYVGYLFVVARGEPAKITEARKAFLWTIVGSLILLGAQAISKALEATVKALGGGYDIQGLHRQWAHRGHWRLP